MVYQATELQVKEDSIYNFLTNVNCYEANFRTTSNEYYFLRPKELFSISSEKVDLIKQPILTLESIKQAISNSSYILDLDNGWDGEDAEPISESFYRKSVNYLLNLGQFVGKEYNCNLRGPEINPGRDGSIDFEWKVNQVHLLINIKEEEGKLDFHYYGLDIKTNNSIKGIKNDLEIDQDLAFWMRKLG